MSTALDVQHFTSTVSNAASILLNYSLNGNIEMDLNSSAVTNLNDTDPIQNEQRCQMLKAVMTFNQVQLIRVIITWFLFIVSTVGNLFVLSCVYKKARSSHVHMIMMHLAIADLAFTFFVMPNDAVWNTTMEWKVGDALCKICQMFKQIGMYIDSFMVVLIAVDRCCSILQPMSNLTKQRRRTKFLVGGAWLLSILCAIPAPVLFGVVSTSICKDRVYEQCVDFFLMDASQLKVYYFFTMFMTFIFPMFASIVSYWLVIGEITNMIKRDRVMMGRRDSCNNIERARKKTLIMTSIVTVSFVLLWGPYYAYALYFWFTGNLAPHEVTVVLFLLMYVHPAIHPLMYGVFMRDVRAKFGQTVSAIEKVLTCNTTDYMGKRRRRNQEINANHVVASLSSAAYTTTTTCLNFPSVHDLSSGSMLKTNYSNRDEGQTHSNSLPHSSESPKTLRSLHQEEVSCLLNDTGNLPSS